MEPFHKILFPYDCSEAASAVAPAVRAMAQKFSARVTVLYAFNLIRNYNLTPYFDGASWQEPGVIPYRSEIRKLRDEDERRVKEFARTALSGVEWSTLVEDGEPAVVIDWAAKREACDLIMMATRGEGKFRRMLPGSVMAKVLHDVDCPVYTSTHAPEVASETHDGYRHILCALRLDKESESALRMAAFMARTYSAQLCVLHMVMRGELQEAEQATPMLREFYERTLGPDNTRGVDVHFRSLNNTVSEGIRNAATEEAADLVVVGRGHAREGLSRVWTHLYTVIRESPCPVLSV